ncbi:SDR family oxidoreductase [Bradyrhizobium manausense]|uniref:SDR family oxidoreductase n=1 Tax=Bradyrhizobium TaxID=374 RepID=UPI001BA6860F|nr:MULTISPECIES: SDR family oxidoreductase [Bradyrhizobium]MBR0829959.1 SDR family oxidoreductase [Bradyrhizobium manausense]UVO27698.1 SDR family oxidoreductase [Bradyrhizobium arachidis]
MASPFDLTKRMALVTGGGRGIGAAIVTRLAEAGAHVVIANRSQDVADALAVDLSRRGLGVSTTTFDRLDRSGLGDLVDRVISRFDRLDILVHNAGGCPWAALDDLDEDRLEQALSINLTSAIWLIQSAVPHMRARRYGRILVTSSISSRLAMGGGAHYSVAKAGVNAFIRGAAFELARDGITANVVEPGFISKPGRGSLSTADNLSRIARHIPMGRIGTADDVAYAMLYLASEQASYVTGQTIVVDGGTTLPETGFAVERQWG